MGDNYFIMSNIEYKLCEIDEMIELCDNSIPELNTNSIPELNQKDFRYFRAILADLGSLGFIR